MALPSGSMGDDSLNKASSASASPDSDAVPASWTSFDDATLLRGMSEGHTGAFDEFFKRHSASILSFLARLVGARSDPEDLLQETFLRVLTHAKDFRPDAPIRPWLFTIARNAAFNALRKSNLRGQLEVQADLSDWQPPARDASGGDPSADAERQEERVRVLAALEDLPPLHREILVLTLFDGFSYEEASRITGDSEGTLRSRAFYALRKLRERMKEHR